MIPFSANHGSIVIGSKGKCIRSLEHEFQVSIRTMKADPSQDRPLPYFLIEGGERSVLFACLKVYSLLNTSMGRREKELKAEKSQLVKENEQLVNDNKEMIGLLDEMDESPMCHTPQ